MNKNITKIDNWVKFKNNEWAKYDINKKIKTIFKNPTEIIKLKNTIIEFYKFTTETQQQTMEQKKEKWTYIFTNIEFWKLYFKEWEKYRWNIRLTEHHQVDQYIQRKSLLKRI